MTNILEISKERIESLPFEHEQHLRLAMMKRYPAVAELPTDSNLYDIALQLQMDPADVVMCLATDPTEVGVQTAEHLIGRPITRHVARAPIGKIKHGGRQSPRVTKDDPRIVTYVAPNPKQSGSGSHLRYQFWEVGITISEARRRGLTSADVKYDIDRGYVKVGDPV